MTPRPLLTLVPPAPAPAFPVAANQCRVVSNDPVNAEYRLLVAEADDVALAARPGQFFHLLCPESGGERPFLRRPMSIYRVDADNRRIGFLYKVTGKGTRGLAALAPGAVLDALGPLGQGFHLPEGTRHVLLVARGVGLATLAPLARYARLQGAAVTAMLSARSAELVMSREELEAAGARVLVVTDSDGSSDPAALEARLGALHVEHPIDFMATCGSNRLFRLVRTLCERWSVPGQIALEAHMGCGTGMCYACVIPVTQDDGSQNYSRVCWDGPVFSVKEVTGW